MSIAELTSPDSGELDERYSPTTAEILAGFAARSARLLDKERPNWHARVRRDDLVMWDADRGLVAQVYGDVYRGVRALSPVTLQRLLPRWAYRLLPASMRAYGEAEAYRFAWNYGFHLGPRFAPTDFAVWEALGEAWLAEAGARMRAAVPVNGRA